MKRSRQRVTKTLGKHLEKAGQPQNSENTTPLQYNVGSVKVEGIELIDQGDSLSGRQWAANFALALGRMYDPIILPRLNRLSKGLPTDDASRKRLQMWTFLMEYFPDAFLAIVEVAVAGNEQHNPGEPLHWAREKSTDQLNTAFRHMWDWGRGVKKDTDGQYHLAKAAWRIMAQLQLDIENDAK